MSYHNITPQEMDRFLDLYAATTLTDAQMAQEIGVHRRTIVRWRQERKLPPHSHKQNLSQEEQATKDRERRKRNTEYLILNHRCVKCTKQDAFTINGRHYCAECVDKANERSRRWRQNPANMQKVRDAQNKRVAERRAAGLCIQCGKPARGRAYCKRHYVRDAEKDRQERIANGANLPRGDNGICWQCNKVPALFGYRVCGECLDKKMDILATKAWPARREAGPTMLPLKFGRTLYGKAT